MIRVIRGEYWEFRLYLVSSKGFFCGWNTKWKNKCKLGFLGGLDKGLRSLQGLGFTCVTIQWIYCK